MKKIVSLTLAGLMLVSMIPTAFAAETQNYELGTSVTVVGDGGEYYVTVPASLEPGQTGTVTAYGKWASNETVKVWTDETVEVTHTETGEKTTVNVDFAGIESLGNDLEDMNVTAPISIDKGEIRFGEWTGVIEYNVEFDDGIADTIMFKDVKYTCTDSSIKNTDITFNSDGTVTVWGQRSDGSSMDWGTYTTSGQNLEGSYYYTGVFSDDGYTFTYIFSDGTQAVYIYTP